MICPECNGKGETIYYVETDRDENTVTVEQRKGICRTCNGSGEKPQTNADRIRAMSDYDLAWFLMEMRVDAISTPKGATGAFPKTQKTLCEWLKKEAR